MRIWKRTSALLFACTPWSLLPSAAHAAAPPAPPASTPAESAKAARRDTLLREYPTDEPLPPPLPPSPPPPPPPATPDAPCRHVLPGHPTPARPARPAPGAVPYGWTPPNASWPTALPYLEGVPPPYGYKLQQDRGPKALAIIGGVLLAGGYGVNLQIWWMTVAYPVLFVPLIGPFAAMGTRAMDGIGAYLAIDGAVQALGFVTMVAGLLMDRHPRYVRADLAAHAPTLTPPRPGLAGITLLEF